MSLSNEFIELDKAIHERTLFECGEAELDAFLRTQAAKHMRIGISRTLVLPAGIPLQNGKYPIRAFYTIAPSSIKRETFPKALAKKLPRYPVPVFLLAQMAVHVEHQGQGLGKTTLLKALENLLNINAHMRAHAVIVDCLNRKAENFYLKYGFEPLCQQNGRTRMLRMFLPMKTIERLFKQVSRKK